MKPRAQTPAIPLVNPTLPPADKTARSTPVPLNEAAMKQVAGGSGTTQTPQRNW